MAARRGISVGRQVPARDSRHETLARRRGASSGVILPVHRKAKSVVRLCPLALGPPEQYLPSNGSESELAKVLATLPKRPKIRCFNERYLPYELAQWWVSTLGMGRTDWATFCSVKPSCIPARPGLVYSKLWRGWGDWLGLTRIAARRAGTTSMNRTSKTCPRVTGTYTRDSGKNLIDVPKLWRPIWSTAVSRKRLTSRNQGAHPLADTGHNHPACGQGLAGGRVSGVVSGCSRTSAAARN